jgi:hypothetical protein
MSGNVGQLGVHSLHGLIGGVNTLELVPYKFVYAQHKRLNYADGSLALDYDPEATWSPFHGDDSGVDGFGNYYVAYESGGTQGVGKFDKDGYLVWDSTNAYDMQNLVVLTNGTTYYGGRDRLIKYNSDGVVLWESSVNASQYRLTASSDGDTWTSSTTGFIRMRNSDGDTVWSIVVDGNGSGFVVDESKRLYVYDATADEIRRYSPVDGAVDATWAIPWTLTILAMQIDANSLYIGYVDAFAKYNRTTQALEWSKTFTNDNVTGVSVDSDGNVFLGFENGNVKMYDSIGTLLWTASVGVNEVVAIASALGEYHVAHDASYTRDIFYRDLQTMNPWP